MIRGYHMNFKFLCLQVKICISSIKMLWTFPTLIISTHIIFFILPPGPQSLKYLPYESKQKTFAYS